MKAFVFLANGFEEVEAITPVDVLRRAGVDVQTVSITDTRRVTGAHGVSVEADLTFKQADFSDAEWLIIPGGMPGASNLHDFAPLNLLLKTHAENGRGIAAICAAPAVVLAPLGLLKGKNATCYPGMEEPAIAAGANMLPQRVVVDGRIITGNGPSSALPFALTIAAEIAGDETATNVAAGMLV